jgi:hypothetical protein
MKQAVFLAVDHGVDGRDRESIRFASLDENARDKWIKESPNKAWLTPVDRVVDLAVVATDAWKKLDALQVMAIKNSTI